MSPKVPTNNRVLILRTEDVPAWPTKPLSEFALDDLRADAKALAEHCGIVIFLPEDCGSFALLKADCYGPVTTPVPVYKRTGLLLHHVITFGAHPLQEILLEDGVITGVKGGICE